VSLALTTARLRLRELSIDDAPATNAWESDPRVTRYQSAGPRTVEESAAFLARIAEESARMPRRLFELAVTTHDDPTLMIKRPDHREAELWYVMRHDVWGRGYAVEALEALLDHAFDVLGVHRVYGDSDPRNTGSVRVLEKLGMRREAHLRENWYLHGEWCDSLIFGVLEDEWRARRRRP
jgi:RimJ/RimL family protein N-acetyltransferase